ncbi:MAG TPA: SpoIID/LytB domain-containing protein [Clostridiaceae bacterium]|nr:SpoIID/LytB domain-containing protein [Clostridiaceae bacterium]
MARKATSFILCIALITGIMLYPTHAESLEYNIPEYIRVALKYEGTALDFVYVRSDTGGTVGIVLDNNHIEMNIFSASDTVEVVSDSNYHLIIGEEFDTYDEVKAFIEVLEEHAGYDFSIPLFPLYKGKWVAAASIYTDEPVMEETTADNGIDEYAILYETFALADLIDTPEGKEEGPSWPVIPYKTERFAMRAEIEGTPLFAVSDPANAVSVRVKPQDTGNPNVVPLLRLYELSQPEHLRFRSRYRGVFDLHRQEMQKKDRFVVVNKLKLEEYLYSVVHMEMSAGYDHQYNERIEALKVQAIVARSFAVKMVELKSYQKYRADIENTTNTQVYPGYTHVNGNQGEWNNTNSAVDQTRGQVLMYDGKLAVNIYYHSNSGGYTEHPIYVWYRGGSYPPYVVSKPDPYTELAPRVWTNTFTGKSIQQTIRNYVADITRTSDGSYTDIGNIKYINVVERSTAGRTTETLIEGTNASFVLRNEQNRWVYSLMGNMYNYEVDDKIRIVEQRDGDKKFLSERARKVFEGEYFTKEYLADKYGVVTENGHVYERIKVYDSDNQTIIVNGRGSGHGVGMSQHGALQMSKLGLTSEEIINFYFPGVQISKRKQEIDINEG